MTTATENTIPLTAEQVGLLYRNISFTELHELGFSFGFDETPQPLDIERLEQIGHRLLLFARVLKDLQHSEFPLDADARALLAELAKGEQEAADGELLVEDLRISEGRVAMLQAILDFAEDPPRGGGA